MGVLNVTPDSFSDGGDFFDVERAVARAGEMMNAGADIIDVGPESTRPGAMPVPASEQIRRAIPVIEAVRTAGGRALISIDTRLAEVARAALNAGASIVNDVSALRDDPTMVNVLADSDASFVLMHRRGRSVDMQADGGPHYRDVIAEIVAFLRERIRFAADRGIESSRIILDPGIGFGKRVEDNLSILRHVDRFVALGQPLLVGASRKSFIGTVLGRDDPRGREAGSLVCAVIAATAGAAILRVHEVGPAVDAIRMLRSIQAAGRL